MVGAATTLKHVFNISPGDVYWCTADCGWITGHSYLTYGPFLNRAVNIVFEGVPTHPTPARCWEIVDKYNVKQFYTAPTAIRSLMRSGDQWVKACSRKSLEILGSVGEPINPEAWRWYHEVVGEGRCPIVDTWWQTETGAHMITPLPGAWEEKPGSATLPFFGVQPVIVDDKGNELQVGRWWQWRAWWMCACVLLYVRHSATCACAAVPRIWGAVGVVRSVLCC